jgi:hypothetical protein
MVAKKMSLQKRGMKLFGRQVNQGRTAFTVQPALSLFCQMERRIVAALGSGLAARQEFRYAHCTSRPR